MTRQEDRYQVRAFILAWIKDSTVLDDDNVTDSDLVEKFIYGRVDHKKNMELAQLFGTVVTRVKVFPTDNQGWMILDKHTKRVLHKGLKNKDEVDLECKKNNYLV